MHADRKSAKITDNLSVIFALLEFAHKKAACKMLRKFATGRPHATSKGFDVWIKTIVSLFRGLRMNDVTNRMKFESFCLH
jgi:hypothetical protein